MEKEIIAYINNTPIFRNFTSNLPCNLALRSRARSFRKRGVLSEVIFWQQVHKKAFFSIDFDRQKIIGSYIVDFYCKSLSLVIEIDGSSHNEREDYDGRREEFLKMLGLRVYRNSDFRIRNDLANVMSELEFYIVNEYGSGSSFEPPRPSGTPPKEGNVNRA